MVPGAWCQHGEFQSLSGFRVRCNFLAAGTSIIILAFQSLSGFRVRCNPEGLADRHKWEAVSIPIGFSSTLQRHKFISYGHAGYSVSIPIGFSSTLQHHIKGLSDLNIMRFQSLSGFRVRCNATVDPASSASGFVSIPIGFSSTLQRQFEVSWHIKASYVSIPIGFSSTLQLTLSCVTFYHLL